MSADAKKMLAYTWMIWLGCTPIMALAYVDGSLSPFVGLTIGAWIWSIAVIAYGWVFE